MNIYLENKYNWIGFLSSIFLTLIPFYVIYNKLFEKKILLTIIILCAITQIFIHLFYFLHLRHMPNLTWKIISLIFTIFIIFVLVIGSIWIMLHLHHNLMT